MLDLLDPVGRSPLLQGLIVALGTFILEDAVAIASGLFVAAGEMAFSTALIGLIAGITLGDIGLYAVGYYLGGAAVTRGWINESRLETAKGWLRGNLLMTVLVSRFVPGSRLPVYLAAGVLKAPPLRFMGYVLGAAVLWILPLLLITISIGEAIEGYLGVAKWPVAILVITGFIVLQITIARKVKEKTEQRKKPLVSFFEFWPPWLFYTPVALFYLKQAVKYRSLTLPTCANPSIYSGGFIKESKSQILSLIPKEFAELLPRMTTFTRGERANGRALRAAEAEMREAGLAYPIVVKPDIGHRGAGVRLVRNRDDMRETLKGFPPNSLLLFQELADLPHEAGVFYVREPGQSKGRIISVTLKHFPSVTGDGKRTLRQLIEDDPRARAIRQVYFQRNHARLSDIIPSGEKTPLVFSGNHCQGAVFTNGEALISRALEKRIEEISSAMPEFYFGRYDLRFADEQSFRRGKNFKIIEINGAGSEATHIWDARTTLGNAYAALFEQFRLLFEISHHNRQRGCRPLSLTQLLRDYFFCNRTFSQYPPAS